MSAKLIQTAALAFDLERERVSGGSTSGSTWTEEYAGTAAGPGNQQLRFNPSRTVGLGILDAATLLRATAPETWSTITVEDLFDTPAGQTVRHVAWLTDTTCAALCVDTSDAYHILYSADAGATWDETASDISGLTLLESGRTCAMASNGSALVVVTEDSTSTYAFKAGRSTDGGATWTVSNGPAPFVSNFHPTHFARNGSTLMLVGYDSATGTNLWAIRTDDGGSSWQTAVLLTATPDTLPLGVERLGSQWVVLGTAGGTWTTWKSSDNGATWSEDTAVGLTSLALTFSTFDGYAIAGTLFVDTTDPLFHRSADGITYEGVSTAGDYAAGDPVGAVLAFGVGFDGNLYAMLGDDGGNVFILAGSFTEGDGAVFGSILQDDGLSSFAALCLFSDRRVPDGVPFDGDRGGWWASTLIGDEWGSLLWTLKGAPNTDTNLRLVEQYAVESLRVMVDEGLAAEVRATAQYHETEWARLRIEIKSGRGPLSQWRTVWENTLNGLLAPNTH